MLFKHNIEVQHEDKPQRNVHVTRGTLQVPSIPYYLANLIPDTVYIMLEKSPNIRYFFLLRLKVGRFKGQGSIGKVYRR